ncbi:MAG: rhomboid family intramembrane serine protease [Chthoniobacteraceae bacterium]
MNGAFPEITAHDGRILAVVGIYETRTGAYERSLVVSAMETPHWIVRHEGAFALCVDPPRAAEVAAELARFESERREKLPSPLPAETAPHSTVSLYACGWILCGFYAIQIAGPPWWEDRGAASSRAIMAGEWWRAFTALTLHAGLGHLGANLAVGLVFAAFLLPILGSGWTWLFVVLAGGIGNWLNAWGHRGVEHLSIGASTAVFAALGIMVAAQCTARTLSLRAVRLREFLLPVGAGLGLLAYLGVGDQQTDYMAHFFGLLAGVPFGIVGVWLRLGSRTRPAAQVILAWSAAALLAISWRMAAP